MTIPSYRDLPVGPAGGRLGWHVFGRDDRVGRLKLISPETIAAAATNVSRGAVFPLDAPVGHFDPPLNPRRKAPRHLIIKQPTAGFDDAWEDNFPQASSQWDALTHVGYTRSEYYNGVEADSIEVGEAAGISAWGAQGIVGRAVVLDVETLLLERDRDYSPGGRTEITAADLESVRVQAGIEFREGDIALIHTGFYGWWSALDRSAAAALPGHLEAVGLEPSEAMCEYLWDSGFSAIATDTFAVEAWPADFSPDRAPFGFLHHMLIGSLGFALGELWNLDDLVRDCRDDGDYTGLLTSAPINAHGGIASPANALVIR